MGPKSVLFEYDPTAVVIHLFGVNIRLLPHVDNVKCRGLRGRLYTEAILQHELVLQQRITLPNRAQRSPALIAKYGYG